MSKEEKAQDGIRAKTSPLCTGLQANWMKERGKGECVALSGMWLTFFSYGTREKEESPL